MKKNESQEPGQLSFEEALEKLEAIVAKMEDGNLPLDQMIKYYEEGNALSSICGKKLKALEKKIEILVKENGEGGEWKNFDPSSGKHSAMSPQAEDEEGSADTGHGDTLF